jgi:hypothetical protein
VQTGIDFNGGSDYRVTPIRPSPVIIAATTKSERSTENMKCPVCSAELPATAKFCGGCGTTLSAAVPPPPPQPSYEQHRPVMNASPSWGSSAPPTVERKYKMLRLIAVLIKIFAFVAAAILIIAGLFMIIAGATASSRTTSLGTSVDMGPTAFLGGAVTGLIMIVYAVFVFVFLYAYAEWMYVFMDIEENTRVTNEVLLGRR